MKLFCPECFAKIEYKFSKPKFCPECGKQLGSIEANTQKNNDTDKIKKLEAQIQQLKYSKQQPIDLSLSRSSEKYDESDESDSEYTGEDYFEIQKSIENFKRRKIRSGVTIEKDSSYKGISFGQLMEGVSSGAIPVGDEFKMTSDSSSKTDKQILEEFKLEASSKSRVIEIE